MNDVTTEVTSHTAMTPPVTSELKRRVLMKTSEQMDAESEAKRSIARISFELKYLSSLSLSTTFCIIPIPDFV